MANTRTTAIRHLPHGVDFFVMMLIGAVAIRNVTLEEKDGGEFAQPATSVSSRRAWACVPAKPGHKKTLSFRRGRCAKLLIT